MRGVIVQQRKLLLHDISTVAAKQCLLNCCWATITMAHCSVLSNDDKHDCFNSGKLAHEETVLQCEWQATVTYCSSTKVNDCSSTSKRHTKLSVNNGKLHCSTVLQQWQPTSGSSTIPYQVGVDLGSLERKVYCPSVSSDLLGFSVTEFTIYPSDPNVSVMIGLLLLYLFFALTCNLQHTSFIPILRC